jgi:hypothetical protein
MSKLIIASGIAIIVIFLESTGNALYKASLDLITDSTARTILAILCYGIPPIPPMGIMLIALNGKDG